MAGLALGAGDAAEAARWLGAVVAALKALGVVMESSMLHFHAQTLAAAKEALGEAAFQSAFDEGSQWSLEEAVKKALGEG
jgi:phosphopantetheinyl transferase